MEGESELVSEVLVVILYSVLSSKVGCGDAFPEMNDTLSVPPLIYSVTSSVSINLLSYF